MTGLLAASEASAGDTLLAFLALGVIVLLYWTPTLIAVFRKGNIATVAVINGFLGWTFIGWVVALAMAFNKPADVQVTVYQAPPPYVPPHP